MRAFVEAVRYFKTNRAGTLPILQKYMGGISAEHAAYIYDEAVETVEELPVPAEKGLQAILDRETDPKARTLTPEAFIDLSFLKEIDRAQAERIYRR
jgi:hypothetical protein